MRIEDQQELLQDDDNIVVEDSEVKKVTRKLLRALRFKDFLLSIDEGINGTLTNGLTADDFKKEDALINYIAANIKKQNLDNKKETDLIDSQIKKLKKEWLTRSSPIEKQLNKRADKGEKKHFFITGLLLILVPYAMGLALPWAAPLGIAFILAPAVVNIATSIVKAFIDNRISKLFNTIKEIKLDEENTRVKFEEKAKTAEDKKEEKKEKKVETKVETEKVEPAKTSTEKPKTEEVPTP